MSGKCHHDNYPGECPACLKREIRGRSKHCSYKTFLECMFNDLNDISEGTDEEVIQELEKAGIDVEKAKKTFLETIRKMKGISK